MALPEAWGCVVRHAKEGGLGGRARMQCHALRELRQGAAEATRVRSMQGRHLLLQGLPGHTAQHRKRGGLAMKTVSETHT